MKLKTLFAPVAVLSFVLFSAPASAVLLDFIDMTENAATGLGESAWATLSPPGAFGLDITGHATGDSQAFAYLDWKIAGLGVCKDASILGADKGNTGNVCDSGAGDDNVTVTEHLEFVFDEDVVIDDIWVNNNHDGGFDATDLITVNGMDITAVTGLAGDANGLLASGIYLASGSVLKIAYKNEEFYVSGISVSAVPVPAAVWLFGTALIGFVGYGRRTSV